MITVVVATYGDNQWVQTAKQAVRSAEGQADEIIIEHQPDGTLASARNTGAEQASGDHLVFLDADDQLDTGYVDAMRAAADGTDTLYAPAVSYVSRGKRQRPKYWPEVPLWQSNWLVIGTMVRRDRFLAAGGFQEYQWSEDWALFARMWRDGSTIRKVPSAVYLAHWRPDSRNKRDRETMVRTHFEIGRDLFPDHYPETWLRQHLPSARQTNR